jgi:hypothetical protein
MPSKSRKVAAFSLLLIGLVLFIGLFSVLRALKSDRLKALVEEKIGAAIGSDVKIESLRLAWPPGATIEGLVVSAPGHGDSPILTCPRLNVSTSIWSLARGHIDSVVVVSPRISAFSGGEKGSNIPDIPPGGGAISFENIKVVDAEIDLDFPGAHMELKGVLATLVTRTSPAGAEIVIQLNIDAVDASLTGEEGEPFPLAVRSVQSQFVHRENRRGNEIEGEIHAGLSIEIPHLLLPPIIPLQFAFELDHLPEMDSIENGTFTLTIPRVGSTRVFGSIRDLASQAPVADLHFSSSPLDFDFLAEYIEALQRPIYKDMKLAGSLSLSGKLKGSLPEPEVSLRFEAKDGRLEWEGFSLEDFSVEAPLVLDGGSVGIETAILGAGRAVIPVGEHALEIANLKATVSGDMDEIIVKEAAATLGEAGEVTLRATYEPAFGIVRAAVAMKAAPIEGLLAYASPIFGGLPDDTSAAGSFDLDLDVEAKIGGKAAPGVKEEKGVKGAGPDTLSVKCRLSLSEGEISYGELFAGAGIDAELLARVSGDLSGGPWTFNVDAEAGGFEILIDTFYKDFSENTFPLHLSGRYDIEGRRVEIGKASLEIGRAGKIMASGEADFSSTPEIAMKFESDRIDLSGLFEEMGGDLLAEAAPDLEVTEIGGIVSGSINVATLNSERGGGWSAGGTLKLADGKLGIGEDFRIGSLSIDMPFGVKFPQEEDPAPAASKTVFKLEDYGKLAATDLKVGPLEIQSLDLDIALKENALNIKGPTRLDIFGGTVSIGAIEGEDILGPNAMVATSLSARDISIKEITESLGLPEVEGSVGADFPEIAFSPESITTDGSVEAGMFGGTIALTSLGIVMPLSSVRTFKADIELREIDLLAVSDVLGGGPRNVAGTGCGLHRRLRDGQAKGRKAEDRLRRRGKHNDPRNRAGVSSQSRARLRLVLRKIRI